MAGSKSKIRNRIINRNGRKERKILKGQLTTKNTSSLKEET
jgi:hypothetical protein